LIVFGDGSIDCDAATTTNDLSNHLRKFRVNLV
jgi:hypothetical protein